MSERNPFIVNKANLVKEIKQILAVKIKDV